MVDMEKKMSSGTVLRAVILVAMLVFAACALAGCSSGEPAKPVAFSVGNTDNATVTVEAMDAEQGVSGVGYLVVDEGQAIHSDSSISAGSIKFVLRGNGKAFGNSQEWTVSGTDREDIEIAAGKYSLLVAVDEPGTTGTVNVTVS